MMNRYTLLPGLAAAVLLAACQPLTPRSSLTPEPALPEVSATKAVPAAHRPDLAQVLPSPESPPSPLDEYLHLEPHPTPDDTAADVLERLRTLLVDPPCPDDPTVQHWIGIYGRSQASFANQVSTMLPWMSMVLDAAERYRLPGEFVLLPIVESSYQPHARGAGDHVGLWQLGRSTATHLDLPVSAGYDGRMDGVASTEAALRYLAEIQNRIGDWKLTALGYNVGPNRVRKLLQELPDAQFSAAQRLPAGLPESSYHHVAKMQAWACLLAHPERHGLEMPVHEPVDPLVAVRLPPGQTSLPAIAKALNLDAELLTRLNPAHTRGFVAKDSARELLLPASLAGYLATPFDLPHANPPAPEATPKTDARAEARGRVHIVKKGDTLSGIARRYEVSVRRLYQINGLNSRSVLRIGQRIRLVS